MKAMKTIIMYFYKKYFLSKKVAYLRKMCYAICIRSYCTHASLTLVVKLCIKNEIIRDFQPHASKIHYDGLNSLLDAGKL